MTQTDCAAWHYPFWAYGPDFVLASIFAPGPYFGADYGYAPRRPVPNLGPDELLELHRVSHEE